MTTRRGLITGLVSLLAAPAIVRASNLMPVKAWSGDRFVYQPLDRRAPMQVVVSGFDIFTGERRTLTMPWYDPLTEMPVQSGWTVDRILINDPPYTS